MSLDLNKKFQDKANEVINDSIKGVDFGVIHEEVVQFLKETVAAALKQGFVWGTNTHKDFTDDLLKNMGVHDDTKKN